MIWICPKCNEPLQDSSQTNSLVCISKHQYDRAKQGYVNLLLANQKNSSRPGDSSEMIEARQAFLRSGFYKPLITSINDFVTSKSILSVSSSVLDLGCGEGYYLEQLLAHNNPPSISGYGIDISKSAIRKAASSSKQQMIKADYAIASGFNLPIADSSVDLVLTVFAPCAISEVQRVLSKDGYFIRVSPGPRHLYQLKSFIYDAVTLHDKPIIDSGFTLVEEIAVQFKLTLSSSKDIENLLAMTPFNWHGKMDAKENLISDNNLTVEIDFIIQCCRMKARELLT